MTSFPLLDNVRLIVSEIDAQKIDDRTEVHQEQAALTGPIADQQPLSHRCGAEIADLQILAACR